MGFVHTMGIDDSLEALAGRHELPGARAIYDAPENAELRRHRTTPESIKFGDRVYVPTPGDDPVHTWGGLSGNERKPADSSPEDKAAAEVPPSRPLADERHAVVARVARNQLNTIDIRPGGHAWFSA